MCRCRELFVCRAGTGGRRGKRPGRRFHNGHSARADAVRTRFGLAPARPARPLLRQLSQPARESGRSGVGAQADARRPRSGAGQRTRRQMGIGRAEAPGRNDAAGQRAPARQGDVRGFHHRSRERAGSHGGALHAFARPASAEPDGVCQRDPRHARARDRSGGLSAARRLDARLRQHRRRARHLVDTRRSVSERGGENQPPRDRRADAARSGRVPDAGGHVAGLSHRRAAVRHARRHPRQAPLPLRRRVHGDGDADFRRQHVADRLRIRTVREARNPARWRAPAAGRLAGQPPARHVAGQLR